jgi:hypothetical protein
MGASSTPATVLPEGASGTCLANQSVNLSLVKPAWIHNQRRQQLFLPNQLDMMGDKKIKAPRRHIMVGNDGSCAANITNPQGSQTIFERLGAVPERLRRIIIIWVNETYYGAELREWAKKTYYWILETIKRADDVKRFK